MAPWGGGYDIRRGGGRAVTGRARHRPGRPPLRWVAIWTAAFVGVLLGIATAVVHLSFDPLTDVHAYYDAAQRLNAVQPLYPAGANVDAAEFYRYPPLLAILFRPLALLPFDQAALVWEGLMLVALFATLWILGIRRRSTWIAAGLLGAPLAWTMSIGQAQALVTLLMTIATPWSLALATNLKLYPALAAVFWVGRKDWQHLLRFLVWCLALGVAQFLLEPSNSLDFVRQTNLGLVGSINNLSPYAISPLLWAGLLVIGVVAALLLARTRWGWAAAVTLSVLAPPRLFLYAFSTLISTLGRPSGEVTRATGPTDALPDPLDRLGQ